MANNEDNDWEAKDPSPEGDSGLAPDLLIEEIRYRRDRLWKLFFWTSIIPFIVIVGVIVLVGRFGLACFYRSQRIFLILLLLLLALCAGLWVAWLYLHVSREGRSIQGLMEHSTQLKILFRGDAERVRTLRKWVVGISALVAIGLVLAASWVLYVRDCPADEVQSTPVWYFAVSGDSRDCGDLIMPKIAKSIQNNLNQAPVRFYWHLGDFRGIYRFDCDMAKVKKLDFNCAPDTRVAKDIKQEWGELGYSEAYDEKTFRHAAWNNFKENQIEKPFGRIPVYLGIGNHELITEEIPYKAPPPPDKEKEILRRMREDYFSEFKKWLEQDSLEVQRVSDSQSGIPSTAGKAYYHFVINSVDFIYLDNADKFQFDAEQVTWLARVLDADAKNDSIKTIIVGMHAALPRSSSSNHAMDASCQGSCSGLQVYDLLYRAQRLDDPAAKRKHVYVLASHSHYFRENIYETPQHNGQVLPGWIIGTAGAEQYVEQDSEPVKYGYLQVGVRPDGTVETVFKEVNRNSPPLESDPYSTSLADFCFTQNKKVRHEDDSYKGTCLCVGVSADNPKP